MRRSTTSAVQSAGEAITRMPMEDFRAWLKDGATSKRMEGQEVPRGPSGETPARFSRPGQGGRAPASESPPLDAPRVERAVQRVTETWTRDTGPAVEVVESSRGLPPKVQAQLADVPRSARKSDGVYDSESGTVYLVSDQIRSPGQARRALAHSAIGFFSLAQILGDDYDETLAGVRELAKKSPKVQRLAGEAVIARGAIEGDTFAAEVLARMAEAEMKNRIMTKVIADARRFLRYQNLRLAYNLDEIRGMVALAARRDAMMGGGSARG